MRLIGTVAGLCVAATALSACSGGGGTGGSGGTGGPGGSKAVDGKTFTMALAADPGNLDPQQSAATSVFQLSRFAYDPLLSIDSSGKLGSGLASSWTTSGSTATLTLKQGITCSDGSPFTAADAAANLAYVADPKNKSAMLGTYLPQGVTASASGQTVTLTLAAPAPFVLQGLAELPMVCKSGLADRSVLAHSTRGTGPYQLTQDVASDHITYTKRAGYTWGPGGASTATTGTPSQVVVKFVSNETTAANLLLSGGLNAATVVGPDAQRLTGSGLFAAKENSLLGEMWFNQTAPRPGADPAVRKALTQALSLPQVQKVLTSGQGAPATSLAVAPPVACPGDTVTALPSGGLAAAKATLDAAGWQAGPDGTRAKGGTPLSVTFVYDSSLGSGSSAAAELASSTWKQLGVKVALAGQDDTAIVQTTLGGSGNWDVAWLTLNVSSPDQLVPFLSGPVPPQGNNFAHIGNATYTAGVAKAAALPGAQGCSTWLAAEKELLGEADVVPFANRVVPTFGKSARFASGDVAVVPTSIRMLAG